MLWHSGKFVRRRFVAPTIRRPFTNRVSPAQAHRFA